MRHWPRPQDHWELEGLCGEGEEPIGETEVSEQERDSKEAIGGHMDFR